MLYLTSFHFPDSEREFDFFLTVKRKCYNTYYPFGILGDHGLDRLTFEPITILYGSNGSGKSTALNIMAETLHLHREAPYNRSSFFEDYTALCSCELRTELPEHSSIITSDDVFDFMLNLRSLNQGLDNRREDLFAEYVNNKFDREFRLHSLDDYEQLKRINQSRSHTQSRYVRDNMPGNVRTHSNGESASMYFTDKIQENALYLLDEPENSLSPARQLELMQFLEDNARFFGCQFIIATHSPFLLSLRGARIYNLDERPVRTARWTDLPNVRAYHNFFLQHRDEFDREE